LIRKFLRLELDKPIAVVDMSTADAEVKKDLKQRIIEAIKASKQPLVTAESLSEQIKRQEAAKKEKESAADKSKSDKEAKGKREESSDELI